ncbi:Yod1 deubiquitinase [Carabus blaptoides fortunei]
MARFALRVKSKSGQQIVEGLNAQSTILDLKTQLSALTRIPKKKSIILQMYNLIGFVLSGKVDTTVAPTMREIIAETVAKDTENYCEAILGKPNKEYCEWIMKPDSWGGAIELAVLSHHYGIEMAVVDTLNAIINSQFLTGQVEAQQHAKSTGHMNFGEV